MPQSLTIPTDSRHVVVIVGGAVAGSEAAALCAERGILAIVVEQNARPFGKIEDGLPRWHEKLQQKEFEQICQNLQRPGVLFVPCTQLGRDLSLDEVVRDWQVNAVLLASGAWRDRPLFAGGTELPESGLVQQNALVYWYNHHHEEGYAGPTFVPQDGAIVVGGGLASIDVVKIVSLELTKRALAERGIHVTTLQLEHDGIPHTLAQHGLSREQLGLRGVTLYYRREKTAMPLASAPDQATPQQLEKVGQVRARLLDKVIERYLVGFEPNLSPLEPLLEQGRFVGVRFQRTRTVDGKLQLVPGELVEVRAPQVISSIGSIPAPLPGLPMRGELIDFEDWSTGKVRGLHNVFGLGNVLTGKGNIKESRKNAQSVSAALMTGYLRWGDEATLAQVHAEAREAAEPALAAAEAEAALSPRRIASIVEAVRRHWARAGYDGDFAAWISRHTARGREQ